MRFLPFLMAGHAFSDSSLAYTLVKAPTREQS